MKKPILKLLMIAMLVVMSSLDAFSVCNASFVKTINGLTVNFQNRSTYNYTPHYYWIFGDGTFSTSKDPIKTYATTGVKSVRLYVSDSSGGSLMCASTVLDTFILISGAPTCQAAFSVYKSGLQAYFYNYSSSSSGSVLHYLWNFPDNTTSTDRDPTKLFTTGGLKVVKLTITDSATSCTSSITDTIMLVGYNCVSNFTKTINGFMVVLNNTSLNGNGTTTGLSYNWSFSEGIGSTLKNPVKSFSSYGVKFIYLQIYDSITNCTSIKKDSFYLGPCQAFFSKTITGLVVNLNNTSLNGNGNTAGLVYNWSFSEGPNTSVKNPVKSFTSYGIKFIHLQIFDSITNCTSTKTDSFNLVAGPSNCHASFVSDQYSTLYYGFRNTSTYTPGHTRFLWNFSDSTTSTDSYPFKSFSSYGMKVIKLTLFDSATLCTSSFVDTIYLNPGACNSRFFASTNALTVNFYNIGNPSNVNYYWSFGDGTYSNQINPIKTYASAGPKYVRLTISDTLNTCYSVYDSFIVVTPPCSANFTKSINGLTVNLTNTSLNGNGTTAGLAYYWYFSEGPALNTGFVKNPVKTFSSYGVKIIQLQIFDSITNCTSTKIDTFNLSSGPQTCSAFFFPGISGLRVTFANYSQTSSGLSNSLFYNWDFGDSTYYTGKIPIKDYLTPGMKIVRLSIYDSVTSCSATYIDTLFLNGTSNNCVANFTKNISGLTVNLTNTSLNGNGTTAGLAYYWYFSEGPQSFVINPSRTFTNYGIKFIQLQIVDSINNCISTKTDSFTIVPGNPVCNATFTYSIYGLDVRITNLSMTSSGAAKLSYLWNFSDGTTSTAKDPIKTFATGGTKIVKLSIYDSVTSCSSSFTDTLILSNIGIQCRAIFSKAVNGLTVNLTNNSINGNGTTAGLAYYWTFSGAPNSNFKNPIVTFPSYGNKTILLTIYDTITNCTSTSLDSFLLVPSASCQANFSKSISGLTVTFFNSSTNTNGLPAGLSYHWNLGDGTFSTQLNPVKTYATGGPKLVTLTITDSLQSCYSHFSDTIMLNSNSMCDASFFGSVNGLTVSYHNTSTNTNGSSVGLSYLWNFSDATTSTQVNPVKTYATAGQKIAKLTIFDSLQACYSIEMDTVTLFAPLCSASFTMAIDTTTPFHFYLLNTSLVRTNSTFLWNFGDGSSSTSITPSHTYANFGTYLVCLTVSDSLCTSVFCDSVGMDSTGILLKSGAFGFQTLDFTTKAGSNGLAQEFGSNQYAIYPNPSNAIFNVEINLKSASSITYQVTDISGKIVLTKSMIATSGKHIEAIDLSEVQSSIYFLSISSNDGISTHKIIKN